MKSITMLTTLVAALLCTASTATAEAAAKPVRVHIHTSHKQHAAPKEHKTHKYAMDAKAFKKMQNLKSTPWDREPKMHDEKCEDLCKLTGFYVAKEDMTCTGKKKNPSLCADYKDTRVAMEVVIKMAECKCPKQS